MDRKSMIENLGVKLATGQIFNNEELEFISNEIDKEKKMKQQVKPIALIHILKEVLGNTRESYERTERLISSRLTGYEVLVVPWNTKDSDIAVKIEAFYPSDFGTIDIEELKRRVEDALTKPR